MNNELAFYSRDSAIKVMIELIENGYVCMFSVEEDLYVVNYESGIWYEHDDRIIADRNAVVFTSVEKIEEMYELRDKQDIYN